MANRVARVAVDLEANSAKFESGLARADRAMQASGNKWKGIGAGISASFSKLATTVGVIGGAAVAAGAGLGTLLNKAIDTASEIADTATKVGVTTDALQELRYAAEQSGVATGTLDLALQRFSRRLGEAAQGKGELVGTLKQYGIQAKDSEGRTRAVVDVLDDYAEAIAGAGSSQEQLRLAFKAFDSEGAALVNLFRDGKVGVQQLRDEAQRLGIVLDEALVLRAKEAGDRLNTLGNVIKSNLNAALLDLAPLVTDMASAFAEAAAAVGRFYSTLRGNNVDVLKSDLAAVNAKALEVAQERADLMNLIRMAEAEGDQNIRKDFASGELRVLNEKLAALAEERAKIQARIGELTKPLTPATTPVTGVVVEDGPTSEKALDVIRKRVAALQLERNQVGLNAGEKERLAVVEAAINQARTDGLALTDTLIAQFGREAEAAAQLAGELEFLASMQTAIDEARREQEQLAEDAAKSELEYANNLQIAQMQAEAAGLFGETARRNAERAIDRQQEINRLTERFGTVAEGTGAKLLAMWDQTAEAQERARQKTEEYEQLVGVFGEFADRAFDRIGASITDAFVRGEDAAISWRNVVQGVIAEIIQEMIKLSVINPLKNAFTQSSGGGDLLPTLFSIFGGARADGGPVMSGRAYLVGEQGPELFAPSMSGSIIPNDAIGSGGGAPVYIDARGVDGAQLNRLERIVAQHVGGHREIVISTVGSERSRGAGGAFGGAFGRT